MRGIKLIINADDLGESDTINHAIWSYAQKHLITSASLLANGNKFDDAVKIAPELVEISIGVHLNLTEFTSLTRPNIFIETGITDEEWRFSGKLKYSLEPNKKFNNETKNAVFNEWSEQIIKILDHGVNVSHFDSHNHVHYHNSLLYVVKKLQKKFSIDKIRIRNVKPLSFYGLFNNSFESKYPPLRKEFSNYLWNLSLRFYRPWAKTTDYVFSYLSLINYLKAGCILPRNKTYEIITHPGSTYLEYFKHENILIENHELSKHISKYKLINYNDL